MLKLNKENLRKKIYRTLKRKKTNNFKLKQTFTLRTKICTLNSDTELFGQMSIQFIYLNLQELE